MSHAQIAAMFDTGEDFIDVVHGVSSWLGVSCVGFANVSSGFYVAVSLALAFCVASYLPLEGGFFQLRVPARS